jgi:UDP-glucose 4-epimerase
MKINFHPDKHNWLITGGCGFIGINLIDFLIKKNPDTSIRILDNLSVGKRDDLRKICSFSEIDGKKITEKPRNIELLIGDIRDPEICAHACQDIDILIHLAASTGVEQSVKDPVMDMKNNVFGILNVLEAAKKNNIHKFIFASSGAPLGEVVPPIHEEKVPKPISPYGASKLSGEGYCSVYYRTFGLKTITLRFGNVYGPRSMHKSSVIAKFFKQAITGEPIEIYGDGNQTRDYIYMDDLIRAIILAASADVGGEIFQIATYRETTVNEIARIIKDLVEEAYGNKVNIIYSSERLGDMKRNYSDISKAKSILKYKPEFDIKTGLKLTFEFFKQNMK